MTAHTEEHHATDRGLERAFLSKMVHELSAIRNSLERNNFLIDEWKYEQNATVIQPLRDYDGPIILTCVVAVYPTGSQSAQINLGPAGRIIPLACQVATELLPSPPAAGALFSYTNNTGAEQWLQSMNYLLTTDATVANRFVGIKIQDAAGNTIAQVQNQTAVVASSTITVQGYLNATQQNSASGTTILPIPNVAIQPGWSVVTTVANIDAGDQISAIHLSLLSEPPGQEGSGLFVADSLSMQISKQDWQRNLTISPAGAGYVNFFGYADRMQVDRSA